MTSAAAVPPRASAFARGRRTFRRWRRGRPFWGGLITIFAGLEFYFSVHLNPTSFAISFGQQGFLAWLTPLVLLLCGFLGWFSSAQRIFYGVVAVATAVYGLISVNLGGFLLGTLLGTVGGALIASWNPIQLESPPGAPALTGTAGDSDTHSDTHDDSDTAVDLAIVPGLDDGAARGTGGDFGTPEAEESFAEAAPAEPVVSTVDMSRSGPLTDHLPMATRSPLTAPEDDTTSADPSGTESQQSSDVQRHSATRNKRGPHATVVLVLALAVGGAALMALRTTAPALAAPCPPPVPASGSAAAPAPSPSGGAGASPSAVVVQPAALLLVTPTPGAVVTGAVVTTPTVDPSPTTVPVPSASATTPGSAGPSTAPSTGTCPPTGTGGGAVPPPPAAKLAVPAGQPPVAGPVTLTAATMAMQGLTFDGVVDLPRLGGGVITVLRFSMSSVTHGTFALDTPGAGGARIAVTAATLTVSGNVTFYCTSFAAYAGTTLLSYTPSAPPTSVPASLTVQRATIGLVYLNADRVTAVGFSVT